MVTCCIQERDVSDENFSSKRLVQERVRNPGLDPGLDRANVDASIARISFNQSPLRPAVSGKSSVLQ